MYEPESDRGFLEGLKEVLERHPHLQIPIREVDLHINDPAFAEQAAAMMHELIQKRGPSKE
jgi:uncharacterized protein (UPF0261 family)